MKIEFNYGKRLAVLPAIALDNIDRASKLDIKVLLAISGAMDIKGCSLVETIADNLAVKPSEVDDSLAFWCKLGVINILDANTNETEERAIEPEKTVASKTLVRRSDEMPTYTTDELSSIIEKRAALSCLLVDAQNAFGKVFNTREVNVVIGMVDYLGLGFDYVQSLLEYCHRIGKKSLNYAEKLAFSFVESGIDTLDSLKEKIAELEAIASNENAVRKLFGVNARAFTAKEKKCIELWFGKFGYDIEVVTLAYEMTVAAINEAKIPYTHRILERWYDENLKTADEIRSSIEQYKLQKDEKKETDGSFDTDDFFEAALKRSYNKS